MSHNFASGRTKGIIHYHAQTEYPQPKAFVQLIEDMKHLAGHPMLLPILIAEHVMRRTSEQSIEHGNTILDIENRTAQNKYWFGKDRNRFTIDYRGVTLDLNTLLTDIEWTTMNLKSLPLLYCRVKDFQKSIRRKSRTAARNRMGTDFAALRDIMDRQENVLSNILISEDSIRERSRTQLDTVRY